MKRSGLLLALFFLLVVSNSVSAVPPTVSFSITPSSGITDQNILFNPAITPNGTLNNMRWMFGSDGNVNIFPTTTTLIDSNFNTTFTGWTVQDGTWANSGGFLVANTSDGTIQFPIAYDSNSASIQLNTRMSDTGSASPMWCFNEPTSGSSGGICANYGIWISSGAGNIQFRYFASLLFTIQTGYVDGQMYDINMTRMSDGNYSFWVDGVYKGSIVDTTSDTNGHYAKLVLNYGGGTGRWGYSQLKYNTPINEDTNQIHTFHTAGTKNVCLTAGNADGNTTSCNTIDINSVTPTVNFTFAPSPGVTDENITFTPDVNAGTFHTINNMRWMFDVDGNVNYFAPPDINIALTQKHAFNSDGNKTVCLTIGNSDANQTICKTVTVANPVIYHTLNDEETSARLTNASATLNGVSWPVNASNGTFDVNSDVTFPLTVVASRSGYDSRTFYFGSQAGFNQDYNLGLRTDTEAQDIVFQFFGPDEVTPLSNRNIVVVRGSIVSGRQLTSGDGTVTFNLASQDGNYDFNVLVAGSELVPAQYVYDSVVVNVYRPKDELTNTDIPGGFNFDVGGLGLQNITNQTSFPFSTIYILGNTVNAYTLRVVDFNGDGQQYFARNLILHALGDTNQLNIHPYLIGIDDGILVNLKVIDLISNDTVPNIRIKLFLNIDNNTNVVEDGVTDSAGIFQVVMQSQKSYGLTVTSPNEYINYFDTMQNLVASSQAFTIWINFNSTDQNFNTTSTTVLFSPTANTVAVSPQLFDINASTSADFNRIYLQLYDTNTLLTQTFCTTSPCNATFSVNTNALDTNTVIARAVFALDDINYSVSRSYFVSPYISGIVDGVTGLKNSLGPMSLGLIMFIIVFVIIGYLGSSIVGNNISQVFLVVIMFGTMFYLWITDALLWMGFFGAVLGVFLLYSWSRNKGGV